METNSFDYKPKFTNLLRVLVLFNPIVIQIVNFITIMWNRDDFFNIFVELNRMRTRLRKLEINYVDLTKVTVYKFLTF